MLNISQIDHVAITVSNPECSIAFYKDVLGMTVTKEWPGEVTALRAGEACLAISWKAKGRDQASQPSVSIHHFAFRVDRKSFGDAQTWLPSKGIKIRLENNGINDSLYLRDPDGHLIELACYEPSN